MAADPVAINNNEPPARINENRKKRALQDISNDDSKEPLASNKKRGHRPKTKDSNKADDSLDAEPKPSQGKSSKASKTDWSSNNKSDS
jgi:hypothetical protein